jgi:hypothetical protein
MWLREWLERKHSQREARRLIAELFRDPVLLRGTSLGPRHASRWVLVGHEFEGGRVARVRFGILRHPRPYAFSPQSHKVVEYYCYEVGSGRIQRVEGLNLTREKGLDADA